MNTTQRSSLVVTSFIVVIPLFFVSVVSGSSIIALLVLLFSSAFTLPLPLSDSGTVRYQTIPWITISIIIINTILFFWWQGYLDAITFTNDVANDAAMLKFDVHLWTYGIRNRYIFEGYSVGAFTALTSVFMHGNHEHLIGNMIFLWAFGRRLEDACGHGRFLVYYVLAGLVAGVGAIYLSPLHPSGYDIPSIGASGAIFGVMGAYLILFPTSRIECLWIPGIFPIRFIIMLLGYAFEETNYKQFRFLINLPSILVIGLYAWFNLSAAQQIVNGIYLPNAGGTIAHAGGFLASILIFLFVRKDLLRRYLKGRNL